MKAASVAAIAFALTGSLALAAPGAPHYSSGTTKFTSDALIERAQDRSGALIFEWHKGMFKGYAYRFVPFDGSGSLGIWTLRCRQDAMTDARICMLLVDGVALAFDQKGAVTVTVGFKHVPNSTVALRIDGKAPITASPSGWDGEIASRILQDLIKAQKVASRYTQWPSEVPTDTQIDVGGLKEAMEFAAWAIQAP